LNASDKPPWMNRAEWRTAQHVIEKDKAALNRLHVAARSRNAKHPLKTAESP
jgi:hypothetical protein